MPVFDLPLEHPMSKRRRYALIALAFIVLGAGGLWYLLRFHTERITVRHFMDAVIAGNMEQAYQIWQPSASYSFQDFLNDWGPNGYYGPVRSFRIEQSEAPKGGGSSVIVKILVSPDQSFPADDNAPGQNNVKEVELWVDIKDQSISFPPY
ncbi:MAG: hypothetical protein WA175_03435 [Candidatus Acidiferrales bacterium]